jgi:branched-chain amino acid transport system substrate-binding protein
LAVGLSLALLTAACSEGAEESSGTTASAGTETGSTVASDTQDPATTGTDAPVDDGSVVSQFAGEPWFMGEVPGSAVAADPDAEPIRIGMLNIENIDNFSFPELRGAVNAATRWVNEELGGVGGRPIEIVPCITGLAPEVSQACAQEMVTEGVVAVVGGIDIASQGAVPVFEQNSLPVIGGIPAQLPEQQSSVNYFFSGGTAGAMAAMLAHASNNDATTVMIANGDLPSFNQTSEDFAGPVAESLGMTVEYQRFPVLGADMLTVLTAAVEKDVDALIVNAADTACVPIMQLSKQLELRAQVYLVGACAAETILDAAGEDAVGILFTGEGPASLDDVEGNIYTTVVDEYADAPAGGAGTVGFRGFMNLYSLLVELGPDNISSESITELVSSAVDRPSFWGHSYTCDGQRIPGLPAICAPESTLFTTTGVPGDDLVFLPEGFEDTDGWVETDDLYAAALG